MLKFYRGDDEILTVIDKIAVSEANYFTAKEEPNFLRVYEDGSPYGVLLTKHTGLQADLPADGWMFLPDTSEILLGQNYTGTIITYDGTIFIFNDEGVAGSGVVSERTLEATLDMVNEYTDFKCVNIDLSITEYFPDETIENSIVTLSSDGVDYYETLTFTELLPSESTMIYVKVVIPDGTATMNYRNLGIEKTYQTEFNE